MSSLSTSIELSATQLVVVLAEEVVALRKRAERAEADLGAARRTTSRRFRPALSTLDAAGRAARKRELDAAFLRRPLSREEVTELVDLEVAGARYCARCGGPQFGRILVSDAVAWIPVAERSPPELKSLLVWSGLVRQGRLHGGRWHSESGKAFSPRFVVTHWRELPEGPR